MIDVTVYLIEEGENLHLAVRKEMKAIVLASAIHDEIDCPTRDSLTSMADSLKSLLGVPGFTITTKPSASDWDVQAILDHYLKFGPASRYLLATTF